MNLSFSARVRVPFVLIAAFLATPSGAAPSRSPPLPPPRPAEVPTRPAPPPASTPAPPAPASAAPVPQPLPAGAASAEIVCTALLGSGHVVAESLPAVTGAGGCGIPAGVTLSAVVLPSGGRVEVRPPIQVACPLAVTFADWVRDDLAPAFTVAGRRLAALSGTSGYSCRGRDRIAGAPLSEHAFGNAVDVGGFVTADDRAISVTDGGAAAILLVEVRQTACARFSTVLGPGSDAYHREHMHVDSKRRHGNYRICQWTLP